MSKEEWRMSETRTHSLRRSPQQLRGQQRINKLLDAAEHVFAEYGYAAATTNAIATYAQTSIGSLYQFFPNKEAILYAIVARYLAEMRTLFDETLTHEATELPLPEFLERIIQGLAHLREAHAGFRPLFFGAQAAPDIAEATQELKEEINQRIDHLLTLRVPNLTAQQRMTCTHVSVAIVQSLMSLAMDAEGDERALILKELQTVLHTYLQTYITNA
jgi:AcrR family transcriptional regulator